MYPHAVIFPTPMLLSLSIKNLCRGPSVAICFFIKCNPSRSQRMFLHPVVIPWRSGPASFQSPETTAISFCGNDEFRFFGGFCDLIRKRTQGLENILLPSFEDGLAKSQEISIESRGDWRTFFAAAKELSRPIS